MRADTYSKSKYSSVISQAGGWEWFQRLLGALHGIAQKHGTSIANVASRWVLDQPQARLSLLAATGCSTQGKGGAWSALQNAGPCQKPSRATACAHAA